MIDYTSNQLIIATSDLAGGRSISTEPESLTRPVLPWAPACTRVCKPLPVLYLPVLSPLVFPPRVRADILTGPEA